MLSAVILAADGGDRDQQPRPPVIYTTPPKPARGILAVNPITDLPTGGLVTFTITRVNDNDSITGTLQLTFDPQSRTRIAEALKGKDAPAVMTRAGVIARFRAGSACPVAHLEIDAMTLESAELHFSLPRVVLTIIEGKDEMTPQLCFLARQINVGKMRRGVIAAINQLIRGGEQEER